MHQPRTWGLAPAPIPTPHSPAKTSVLTFGSAAIFPELGAHAQGGEETFSRSKRYPGPPTQALLQGASPTTPPPPLPETQDKE